jgi:mitogen-activated protein kinase kinase kinase
MCSSLTNKLMVRVANYFDTQVQLPYSDKKATQRRASTNIFDGEIITNNVSGKMTDEQKVNWYSKILDNVRLRYRKLQRFARYVSSLYEEGKFVLMARECSGS